jgi:hypothetical protein
MYHTSQKNEEKGDMMLDLSLPTNEKLKDTACYVFALTGIDDEKEAKKIVKYWEEFGMLLLPEEDIPVQREYTETEDDKVIEEAKQEKSIAEIRKKVLIRLATKFGLLLGEKKKEGIKLHAGYSNGEDRLPDHVWLEDAGFLYDKSPGTNIYRRASGNEKTPPASIENKGFVDYCSIPINKLPEGVEKVIHSKSEAWEKAAWKK